VAGIRSLFQKSMIKIYQRVTFNSRNKPKKQ